MRCIGDHCLQRAVMGVQKQADRPAKQLAQHEESVRWSSADTHRVLRAEVEIAADQSLYGFSRNYDLRQGIAGSFLYAFPYCSISLNEQVPFLMSADGLLSFF
jgi:hypothetical protein